MRIEFKKLFDRIELYIIITLGLLFAIISLMTNNLTPTLSAAKIFSAYQASMIYSGGFAEMFCGILLPAFAVLPFADSYFTEKHQGSMICSLTRQSRIRYIAKKAFVAFTAAILVIFITYLFNQVLCLIAYPVSQTRTFLDGNIYSNPIYQEVLHTPTPSLYMNSPLVLNIIHVLYACLYGGSIAMLSYCLSLYIYKNKAVTNLLPIAICLIWTFAGFYIFGAEYSPSYSILSAPTYSISSLMPSIIIILLIHLGSIVGIILRCYHFKDEL